MVCLFTIIVKTLFIGFLNRHEHLYAQNIQNNIIISDQFRFISPKDIKGCKVMLCTLSMLSNVFIGRFTSQNPIKTLIIDEASQIEINNYVSVLVTSSKLRKMCFIGDDRQCKLFLHALSQIKKCSLVPPFGQEDLQDLQSIFEVPHLRPQALFLDTQCKLKQYLFKYKALITHIRSHASTNW